MFDNPLLHTSDFAVWWTWVNAAAFYLIGIAFLVGKVLAPRNRSVGYACLFVCAVCVFFGLYFAQVTPFVPPTDMVQDVGVALFVLVLIATVYEAAKQRLYLTAAGLFAAIVLAILWGLTHPQAGFWLAWVAGAAWAWLIALVVGVIALVGMRHRHHDHE